ncbi:2OG-Fe dioxygenase family protein [Acidovorax sp. FG27]|uniref:2OG-Fe dioxygenase family protein n=1 Tax=Acidovorax sp. FG27 TaxID=3133652 RepID=UPI0030E932BC
MGHITFSPPYASPADIAPQLRDLGHVVLRPQGVMAWSGTTAGELQALAASWADLPPDEFLKDGGRYRRRRHASFVAEPAASRGDGGMQLRSVAHRAHWQPVEYNALHGGMERWFAPVADAVLQAPAWQRLLAALASLAQCALATAPEPWFVEAHQFRIDTAGGIGRPTPEGAHRDGVDLVAVFLVAREGVKGGETRIFDAASPFGQRFTLTEPWSVLLLDDTRMIHETTPIQPVAEGGWRDTLVVTCRRGGFQDAVEGAAKIPAA